MKRLLLPALLLALFLCACDRTPAPATSPGTSVPTAVPVSAAVTQAPAETTQAPIPDPVTLVEEDGFSLSVVNLMMGEDEGFQLLLRCGNNTEKTLIFSLPMVSSRGWLLNPGWFAVVEPGQTLDSTFSVSSRELSRCGLSQVEELCFRLTVGDEEDRSAPLLWDEIMTCYPTGLTAETLSPMTWELGSPALTEDREDFTFAVLGREEDQPLSLLLYLENKSDRELTFLWEDVTVNGQPMDPYFFLELPAGLRTCAPVTFDEAALGSLGIAELETLDFTLVVRDTETLEDQFSRTYSQEIQ